MAKAGRPKTTKGGVHRSNIVIDLTTRDRLDAYAIRLHGGTEGRRTHTISQLLREIMQIAHDPTVMQMLTEDPLEYGGDVMNIVRSAVNEYIKNHHVKGDKQYL